MTFTTNACFFGVQCCGLKLLPNMINRGVLASVGMRCLKMLIVFAFKMYYQMEVVMATNDTVNQPINCLEYVGVI